MWGIIVNLNLTDVTGVLLSSNCQYNELASIHDEAGRIYDLPTECQITATMSYEGKTPLTNSREMFYSKKSPLLGSKKKIKK